MNQSTTPLLANSNTDPAVLQERSRVQAALRERQQAELATHLGGRYSQWETYQQDRSVHMQVANLRRSLDSVGQALPEAQVRPLVAALANEQQRTRQQTTDMLRNLGRPADPQSQAEFLLRRQEEQLRLLVESNQRVLDAARSHLNAAQFDTFRSMLDAQVAMSRASARAAREQAAGQGAQTATAVPGINIAY